MGQEFPFNPPGGGALAPLPGQGATNPRFDRMAGERELAERLDRELRESRGTQNRGTDAYALKLRARTLAAQAPSAEALADAVRRDSYHSHSIRSQADAQALAREAFTAYAQRQRISDTDFVWIWTATLDNEYRARELQARREHVGALARGMEQDKILGERLRWQDQVNALAAETGLAYEFVESFLIEFNAQTAPRNPAVIDPRGVPMIGILGVPRMGIAVMVKDYILPFTGVGVGISVYEAVSGRDLLSGRELETWERVLGIAAALLPVAMRGASKAARASARVAGAAVRVVVEGLEVVAAIAVRAGFTARTMLRYLARLGRVSIDKLQALFQRVRRARAQRTVLQLTDADHQLMREIDDAFREFHGPPTAAAPVKAPTAAGFIFLNRAQPQVLGRMLGRTMARAAPAAGRTVQEAQRVADDLVARMRAHWDAALPKGGLSAAQAADRTFRELLRNLPGNANRFVRTRLYDLWRQRAMRRMANDTRLVHELEEQAGIVIGHNPKTDNYTMHVRTKAAGGGRTQTHIDFDHALTRHEDAVEAALRNGDASRLISTVDSANLQLMTARENRNFIEALRRANEGF